MLPSHERVFRGLHTRTQEVREHHEHHCDMVRMYLTQRESCTSYEAMKHLFPKLRSAVDDMLGLGETIAHLSWLRYAGMLRRVLDEDGVYRFSLADASYALTRPAAVTVDAAATAEATPSH